MKCPHQELQKLKEQSLLRELREVSSAQAGEICLEGQTYVNFSSNDYLGLSTHPVIKKAFQDGVEQWGAGSGASRLISGSLGPHGDLERAIASYKGKPAARVFANGYTTSVGVLSGLCDSKDVILLDKLSHASLIDGAKLSKATLRVFPHNDMEKLEKLLAQYQGGENRVVVVTESVFSMDGDTAPLAEIIRLKNKYGAMLLVDEAHGLGVCGPMGLAHELGLAEEVDLHMGTLGKSAGVAGGYVACSEVIAQLIVNRSRSFIYSTAPPPAQSVAALAALELIHAEEGDVLREKLWQNIRHFAELMKLESTPESAIIPVLVGSSEDALKLSSVLKEQGFLVPAVRFPTVPRGTARLRLTLSAAHTPQQIEAVCAPLRDQS